MRRLALSSALILFLRRSLAARLDETDEFITGQVRDQHIPGLTLAIVEDAGQLRQPGRDLILKASSGNWATWR